MQGQIIVDPPARGATRRKVENINKSVSSLSGQQKNLQRGRGGLRSVVAESLLVKHQLRILNRGRTRALNLRAGERFIAGLCTLS